VVVGLVFGAVGAVCGGRYDGLVAHKADKVYPVLSEGDVWFFAGIA